MSSEGLTGLLWALSMCFCALDMWICPTEKVLQPTLIRKKVLCLMFESPRLFCKFHANKVLRRSQKTLVGTFNVFLSLGHVNLSHRKSSPTKPRHQKSSLSHDCWSGFGRGISPGSYGTRNFMPTGFVARKRAASDLLFFVCFLRTDHNSRKS